MKLLALALSCTLFSLASVTKAEPQKKAKHLSAAEVDSLLTSVFDFFDKDKDDVITNAEIRKASEGTGKLQENLDQFGQADTDKNGDITRLELKTMFEGPVPGSE